MPESIENEWTREQPAMEWLKENPVRGSMRIHGVGQGTTHELLTEMRRAILELDKRLSKMKK